MCSNYQTSSISAFFVAHADCDLSISLFLDRDYDYALNVIDGITYGS